MVQYSENITLSSAEAELVAAVKMSTELIGITQLAADWGHETRGTVHVDSSAAIGVVSRKGCGKLRHVRVGDPWIQEKVAEGDLNLVKVDGEWNPAGLLTKRVGRKENQKIHGNDQPILSGRKGWGSTGAKVTAK